MSQFAPAPKKPDSRVFASYPMPAKIDLINEQPRRESLLEQQLGNILNQPQIPRIEISGQQQQSNGSWNNQPNNQQVYNQSPNVVSTNGASVNTPNSTITTTTTSTTSATTFSNQQKSNNAAIFAAELAAKEAKLMAEITALHERPYSPFQVPAKIDLTDERNTSQRQYQNAPSPRPSSGTSSIRSTSADLMDKEAKLLQEIEEIERKPYNPQTMVVEREQWYEYPEDNPYDKHLTDSRRRIKDFCSLPSHMYPKQGAFIHENNLTTSTQGRPASSAGSIHTTIIRSPAREVDNKSPLPFAFDNFSTKGVRGNLASAGAIEPDRPRPPIYPMVKRTPSPSMTRG